MAAGGATDRWMMVAAEVVLGGGGVEFGVGMRCEAGGDLERTAAGAAPVGRTYLPSLVM